MWLGSDGAGAGARAGSCSSDSAPSLGTSLCHRGSPKKKKKRKEKKRKKKRIIKFGSGEILSAPLPFGMAVKPRISECAAWYGISFAPLIRIYYVQAEF